MNSRIPIDLRLAEWLGIIETMTSRTILTESGRNNLASALAAAINEIRNLSDPSECKETKQTE